MPTTTTYLALVYELVDDYLDRRPPLRAEHLAKAEAARERGELVLAGALAEPVDKALLVWAETARDAAQQFARSDPYVVNGLVKRWTIQPWNVVVGEIKQLR
jgi:uncharacterized protein YciI